MTWTIANNGRAVETQGYRPECKIMATWWEPDSIRYASSTPGGIDLLGLPMKIDNPKCAKTVAALRKLVGPPPWEKSMETPNDIVNQLNTTCTAALKQWGATAQLAKFHEEICECSVAITHGYSRGHVRLECADVIIMAWQMALNHADSPDDVLSAIREKLSRLNERIATDAAARSAILELNGEVHQ